MPETKIEEATQEVPVPEIVAPEEKTKKSKSKKTKEKKSEQKLRFEPGKIVDVDTKTDLDLLVLPVDENDPHWDPKMRNPVPDALIDNLVDDGWDPSMAAIAYEGEDGKLHIIHGKTRVRSIPKVNKLRHQQHGFPPIVAKVLVVREDQSDDQTILANMMRNASLNYGVQWIDPMTTAESIARMLNAGVDERKVAKKHAMDVNALHGHLLLLDEDKCPPNVQELVRSGALSFNAALELARRAEKMTKSELQQAAEQIARMNQEGVRVTADRVKRAAGVSEEKPATQRDRKKLILELQSGELTGKHAEAAKWAAIIAFEVGIGTRTVDQFWSAIAKIAKGQSIRVDFKQYDSVADKKTEKEATKK